LLDLVEAFLNALNTEFGLWVEPVEEEEFVAPRAADDLVTSLAPTLGDQISSARALLTGKKPEPTLMPPSFDNGARPGSLAEALAALRAERTPAE
jgi:hypothetical protein